MDFQMWPVGGTLSLGSVVSSPSMWVGPLAEPSPGVGPRSLVGGSEWSFLAGLALPPDPMEEERRG